MIRTEHLPLLKRILRQCTLDEERGCWLWTGRLDKYGYVPISVGGKTRRAHVVVFELFVGPRTKGLVVDHGCHVRRCLNPNHLEQVTNRTNVIRGVISRRAAGTLPLPFPSEN